MQRFVDESTTPKTTVELSVSCKGLLDRDILSKSDPVCVLYMKNRTEWTEFARTERIKNSLDPSWQKKIIIDYRFEERQLLKFLIYDKDNSSAQTSMHDSLGELQCSLGEIVSAQSRGFTKNLTRTKGSGSISITALEMSSSMELVRLSFSAKGLDNKDTFGKSDPFLQINRLLGGGDGTVVHRSETIDNNLNPNWKSFELDSRTLCNSDENVELLLSVYDEDNDGSHDLIGSVKTTLKQLAQEGSQLPLINAKKAAKKGSKYKNSGILMLNSIKREKMHTFLDYIQGGLQVNFTIGIDFTGSNGPPQDPRSLHYMDPDGRDNQYSLAIKAVGDIIQDYDYDKMFPCLGFGAKVPPNYTVSHEFFLTLEAGNPFCAGIPGIMNAYSRCLQSVQFYGPTNFSPVIQHVAQFARAHQGDPSNYFVLLIITDGIITDMEDTKRSIVGASTLPMSLIIVGVGDEDFSAMRILDGDDKRLQVNGQKAERDIVQFVELRKFIGPDGSWSKENLARAVLAEVPNQVLSFMQKNGFKPNAVPS